MLEVSLTFVARTDCKSARSGAVSGYVGAEIAATEIAMANTAGIAVSSFTYSVGTAIYTEETTNINVSFGVGSYDLSNNTWDGIWNWNENSTLENIGYSFGGLANLSDAVSLFGGGINGQANARSTKDPYAWHGHESFTGEDVNISVGPLDQSPQTLFEYLSIQDGVEWKSYKDLPSTWSVPVKNVNASILKYMTENIQEGHGLFGLRSLKWNGLGNSCVNQVSRALWTVGVPTLPLNLHPYILNTQLLIRNIGIYSSPYIYDL